MTDTKQEQKETCCQMRRKVVLFLGPILPEEVCGVPETVLADFMRFDLDGPPRTDGRKGTKGVLGFRFCPWCGKTLTDKNEVRITAIQRPPSQSPDEDSGEEWKKGS